MGRRIIVQSMLCGACQNVVHGRSPLAGWKSKWEPAAGVGRAYVHHPHIFDIEAAAQAGCPICSILWSRFTEPEKTLVRHAATRPSWKSTVVNLLERRGGLSPTDLLFYGWYPHPHLWEPKIIFQFGLDASKVVEICLLPTALEIARVPSSDSRYEIRYAWSENWSCAPQSVSTVGHILSDLPVTGDMDSAVNWALIKAWLRHCSPTKQRHQSCHEWRQPASSEIPTRLIDVAAGGKGQDPRLSLRHAKRKPLPYVTLSYPWGPEPDVDRLPLLRNLLRKSNLATFSRKIPLKTLPRLFQDAIRVTRRLGYRYLWIDALCILQDDRKDFLKESALMGEIYARASLNISAGGATSSRSPLFGPRNDHLVRPFRCNLDWRAISNHPQANEVKEYFLLDGNFMEENVQNTPLNRRAWVMQERMLSSRVLHFGKHQLFFWCLKSEFCETFPTGMPEMEMFALERNIFAARRRPYPKDLYRGGLVWFRIVQKYSECRMTDQTDKLVAISGLARVFGATFVESSETYLAGIWSRTIVPSLLWSALDGKTGDGAPCRRHDEYVAPSWSWASVCGKITHPGSDEFDSSKYSTALPMVDVLETFVLPLDVLNPYGQVRDGYIRIRGVLLVPGADVLWWAPNSGNHHAEDPDDRNDNARDALFGFHHDSLHCVFDDIEDYNVRKRVALVPGMKKRAGVAFLPLLRRDDSVSSPGSGPRFEGLVVARVENNPDEYRRIGYFKSKDEPSRSLASFFAGGRREITLR